MRAGLSLAWPNLPSGAWGGENALKRVSSSIIAARFDLGQPAPYAPLRALLGAFHSSGVMKIKKQENISPSDSNGYGILGIDTVESWRKGAMNE